MKAKTRLPNMCHEIDVTLPCFFALALLFCRGFLGHQMDQPGPSKLTLSPRLFAGVAWKFAQIWSNGGGKVTECLFKTPWPNFIFRELYGQIDHVQKCAKYICPSGGLQRLQHHCDMASHWNDERIQRNFRIFRHPGFRMIKKLCDSSCTLRMWWEYQCLFLVPLKGGRYHIIPQLAVYTTYILPIGWLCGTYHLLREPGNSIENETHETGYVNHESDSKYGEIFPRPQWKKNILTSKWSPVPFPPSERQLWKDLSEMHKAW